MFRRSSQPCSVGEFQAASDVIYSKRTNPSSVIILLPTALYKYYDLLVQIEGRSINLADVCHECLRYIKFLVLEHCSRYCDNFFAEYVQFRQCREFVVHSADDCLYAEHDEINQFFHGSFRIDRRIQTPVMTQCSGDQ